MSWVGAFDFRKMKNEKIAVVGAGIAGLLLARELKAAGRDVVVLEKGRGVGGRLATKRVGTAVFDQGAQYFTAKTARFAELVETWHHQGVVTQWPGASAHRWIGRPSMNALGKILAEGLEVQREAKVLSVRRDGAEWEIAIEGQAALRTGQLALTAPTPQALALLRAGGIELPAELTGGAGGVAVSSLPSVARNPGRAERGAGGGNRVRERAGAVARRQHQERNLNRGERSGDGAPESGICGRALHEDGGGAGVARLARDRGAAWRAGDERGVAPVEVQPTERDVSRALRVAAGTRLGAGGRCVWRAPGRGGGGVGVGAGG